MARYCIEYIMGCFILSRQQAEQVDLTLDVYGIDTHQLVEVDTVEKNITIENSKTGGPETYPFVKDMDGTIDYPEKGEWQDGYE